MLTRLMVTGFKNLVNVDVRFGAFTCVAGANGVGKSNLFDAIRFLSGLADRPLIDAALSVRDEGGRGSDVRSLFHRVGEETAPEMAFTAEMIVPSHALDDLGQEAKASITFLRYEVILALRPGDQMRSSGSLELVKEELVHINLSDAHRHLLFPHNAHAWRRSVVRGERRVPFFISTFGEGASRVIRLHQDGGSSGRPLSRLATNLPRTVLSVASAAESPTALLARREMQSWRLLQLEPSAMRRPDELKIDMTTQMGVDGAHLAAALYHMARVHKDESGGQHGSGSEAEWVYGRVAARLSELIEDVGAVWVDRDEKRELLTLQVTDRSGTVHAARSLSDGTLRFLALAVLALEQESPGLLCLEEPENGIHPDRIPAMLRLLQDIATDVTEAVDRENPLRQVIINTHSPAVVAQVPDESLLVAQLQESVRDGHHFKSVVFSPLPGTWRTRDETGADAVARGKLLSYLNPFQPAAAYPGDASTLLPGNGTKSSHRAPRVIDRPDMQLMLPLP
jgi:predicted ATPase